MKQIIIMLCAMVALNNFAADAKNPTSELRRKSKKKCVTKTTVCHEKVSQATNDKILALNKKIVYSAKKQMKICGKECKANMLIPYKSSLLGGAKAHLMVDIRYTEKKEYFADKDETKKFTITIYGDSGAFLIRYENIDEKKFSLKYGYTDYGLASRPSDQAMEKEIVNALAAISQTKILLHQY